MSASRLKSQKHQPLVNKILNSKKIVFNMAHATLFFTSVASAGTMGPIAYSPFQGPYVGLAGGGAFTTANGTNSSSISINFPNAHSGTVNVFTNSPSVTNSNLINNSGIGALLIGYGLEYKRLYLGIEGFVDYSNYQMNNSGTLNSIQFFSDNNQSYIVNNNWQVNTSISPFQGGLDLRPGFFVTPSFLAYGLVGFSVAKITQSTIFTGNVIYSSAELGPQITSTAPFAVNQYATQSVVALRLGGGFEFAINPSWTARIGYAHVNYGNINSTNSINQTVTNPAALFGNGTLTVNNTVGSGSIATNTIMVGISRYFA